MTLIRVSITRGVTLNDDRNIAIWKWTASKKFSVRSVYEQLSRDESGPNYKRIWKAKIPKKIKIFMWLVEQQAILTKDNMVKRRWQGDPGCLFCGAFETPDHLLFSCSIAKVVWAIVAICFHRNTRPSDYAQFWVWIDNALPGGGNVAMLGLAAICWATWKL
jgi:hypothetical protein